MESLTVPQLKKLIKEYNGIHKITKYSKLRREELLDIINKHPHRQWFNDNYKKFQTQTVSKVVKEKTVKQRPAVIPTYDHKEPTE